MNFIAFSLFDCLSLEGDQHLLSGLPGIFFHRIAIRIWSVMALNDRMTPTLAVFDGGVCVCA